MRRRRRSSRGESHPAPIVHSQGTGRAERVSYPRSGSNYNVLFITLDTTRADHIGGYGDAKAETPNLDRLIASGIRFDQAIAAAPLTSPSHASIFTGLLPLHHGVRNNGAASLPDDIPTLASELSRNGYRTGAFIGSFVPIGGSVSRTDSISTMMRSSAIRRRQAAVSDQHL